MRGVAAQRDNHAQHAYDSPEPLAIRSRRGDRRVVVARLTARRSKKTGIAG